jgi:hypothetical protein
LWSSRRTTLVIVVLLGCVSMTSAGAQNAPYVATARQLLGLGPMARDSSVEVTGNVSRYEGSNSFILEDDYGVGIRVVVSGPRPARDLRVKVTGIVGLDSEENAYIMAQRIDDPTRAAAPPADSDRDGVPDEGDACTATPTGVQVSATGCPLPWLERGNNRTVVLGGLGFLALAAGLAVALRRPSPTPIPTPPASGSPASDVDEGKTIRIARPDSAQGTLQILPGRLEITGGGDQGRVSDIRFVRDPLAAGDPEMTFGRAGTLSPTHIILKSQTVSRLHARMRFAGNRWSIQNCSDTNPLLHNGQPLRVDTPPVPLQTGDTIEMGEVSFRFHER